MRIRATWLVVLPTLLSCLIAIHANAAPLWQFYVGERYEYSGGDTRNDTWAGLIDVTGTVILGSHVYHHLSFCNVHNDNELMEMYVRSDENIVFRWNGGPSDYMDFQQAPVGTTWWNGTQFHEILPMQSIHVPYFGKDQYGSEIYRDAVVIRSTEPPDQGVWYQYVVPGVGLIKQLDIDGGSGVQTIIELTNRITPADHFDTVQKVYIGYYQRPADPEGLLYWAGRLAHTNGHLNEIVEAYAHSSESQTLYGTISGSNIATVVDNIYMALFNRHAEAGGLAWYVNGFNAGQYTAATIMLNVLYGAQNQDVTTLNNKLATSNLFTRTIDPEFDLQYSQVTYAGDQDAVKARTLLRAVTDNPATIPTQADITTWMKDSIADTADPIMNQ